MSGAKSAETHYPRLWALVSIAGAVVTAGVTGLNAWLTAEKNEFDRSVVIARLYFERVGSLPEQPERRCPQLRLAGDTAVTMAGLGVRTVEQHYEGVAQRLRRNDAAERSGSPQPGAPAAASPAADEAAPVAVVAAVARLVYADMRDRWRQDCDARFPWPGWDTTIATATPQAAAPAGPAQPAAVPGPAAVPTPAAPPLIPPYTIYIQYQRESAAGRARAEDLQQRIAASSTPRSFVAPGTEAVRQVPNANEIRIYRATDAPAAERFRTEFGLEQFRIVNLSRSFANLPPRVIEVWLAAR